MTIIQYSKVHIRNFVSHMPNIFLKFGPLVFSWPLDLQFLKPVQDRGDLSIPTLLMSENGKLRC